MSGKEDKPENDHHVIYELKPQKRQAEVTIPQDNIGNEKELQHMEKLEYDNGGNEKITGEMIGLLSATLLTFIVSLV